jgi:ABC-type branched-subunit amino acid transport system ATPase component
MGARGLAYVPQSDNIFRQLTIRENLLLVLRRAPDRAGRMEELFDLFPALRDKSRGGRGRCPAGSGRCWPWPWRSPTGRGWC